MWFIGQKSEGVEGDPYGCGEYAVQEVIFGGIFHVSPAGWSGVRVVARLLGHIHLRATNRQPRTQQGGGFTNLVYARAFQSVSVR